MGIASLIGTLAVLISTVMVIVALTASKKHQKVQETMSEGHDHPFSLEGSSALAPPSPAPESAPSTSDGPKSVARAGGSPRDALEADLKDRAASGRCLICTERSTHPTCTATWIIRRCSARRITTFAVERWSERARR